METNEASQSAAAAHKGNALENTPTDVVGGDKAATQLKKPVQYIIYIYIYIYCFLLVPSVFLGLDYAFKTMPFAQCFLGFNH